LVNTKVFSNLAPSPATPPAIFTLLSIVLMPLKKSSPLPLTPSKKEMITFVFFEMRFFASLTPASE